MILASGRSISMELRYTYTPGDTQKEVSSYVDRWQNVRSIVDQTPTMINSCMAVDIIEWPIAAMRKAVESSPKTLDFFLIVVFDKKKNERSR